MPGMKQHQHTQTLSRQRFVSYVRQQLQEHVNISSEQSDELGLTLRICGAPVRLDLGHCYADYQRDPDRLDSLVGGLLRSARSFTADQLITNVGVLRPHIYPMLKPAALLQAVHAHQLPMLAHRPFLAGLAITYVVDERGSVTYINEQHTAHWQIDPADLHAQALENLRQRSARSGYTTLGSGEQRLFISNTQDGYDAARLLLPDLLEPWALAFSGRLLIGIPNRDFLVAFSAADPTIAANVAHQIAHDVLQHPAGLTDRLFTLVAGEIYEYTLD